MNKKYFIFAGVGVVAIVAIIIILSVNLIYEQQLLNIIDNKDCSVLSKFESEHLLRHIRH